jgi:hypothetical protein
VDRGVFPIGSIMESLDVRSIDGREPGGVLSMERVGEAPRLRSVLTRPGRYRVAFRAMTGYHDVAPFEIDVGAGEFAEKVITLVRAE